MANGETRKAIKEGTQKAADDVKRLTANLGTALKDLGRGTVDAILKPQTIPQKLEHAFDNVVVQPVHRTIDFIDESFDKKGEDGVIRKKIIQAQRGAQKLKVVFAAPLKPMEFGSFVAKEFPKKDTDKELIEEALRENFVFSHLSGGRRDKLIGAFEPIAYGKGSEIIKEGDVGDYFYVIGDGEVDFVVDGQHVGTAGSGKTFGELALLYQAPRAATCLAKTECGLFRLDQEHFRRILMMQAEDQVNDVTKLLKEIPYFKDLDQERLNKIAVNLKLESYKDGDIIAERIENVEYIPKFVIVQEGTVKVTKFSSGGSDYKDLTFGPGQFYGGKAILEDNYAINATATAQRIFALSSKRFS